MDIIKINWNKFREAFSKIGYFTFDENLNNNALKPKFLLSDDEKEAIENSEQVIKALPQLNTFKFPLENMNPDIIAMILNLDERLSKIENDYKHEIEVLKQDNMTMKAIFTCNGEKEPESFTGHGTLEDLEIYYNNNHNKENQKEFKLSEEIKKDGI